MKTILAAALAAAVIAAPQAVGAQALPPAVVAVVDMDRIYKECTACKTANAQLESQANGLRSRQEALAKPLQSEGQTIQTAINALGGKEPDAGLTTRIKAFQTKQEAAQKELAGREQGFQRNRAYVLQQINAKLDPVLTQVMSRRGANIMVEAGSTLRINKAVDITSDVLTALNATLTSVTVTAPAAAARTTPAGR